MPSAMAPAAWRLSISYAFKYWPSGRGLFGYSYDRLRNEDDDEEVVVEEEEEDHADDMTSPEDIVVSETGHNGVDPGMEKRVLRKIDRRIIPLLFVTYMLNFMDKTILSSASVFGLSDDTVRTHI